MTKGGKGRKGGGGGGGKTRKYSRDNNGRFASAGTGATARGGRLLTAKGNKRKTQKRIIFSAESKKLGGAAFDASVKSGKINMPVKYGGEGAGNKTQRGKAAAAAARSATDASRAEKRRAGLPKSGGAMRVKGGIKRDPGAAAKLASKTKPTSATAKPAANKVVASPRRLSGDQKIARDVMTNKKLTSDRQRVAEMQRRGIKPGTDMVGLVAGVRAKQGGGTTARIKPAAKPSAAAAAAAAAKPARAARTPKTGQEIMKSEVRKVQNKRLRDLNADIKSAGPNATSLRVEKLALKTRMIDTQPRQTAKQLAKSAKQDVAIRGRIAEMRKQNARVARAQSNVTKNADVRNSTAPMSKASFARRPSKKTMRSQLRADNALAFYANPAKALREVKKKPGFRKPRSMR